MAVTTLSQLVSGGLDTALPNTGTNGLSGLVIAGYCLGSAINNVPASGTTVSFDMADLLIKLSSAVTAGSGSVGISVWILPSIDGTNYPTPPGATAAAAPPGLSYIFPMVPGASTQNIVCPNIPIPPNNFKVMIQNNLGVAFPNSTASSGLLQRKTMAQW